MQKFGAIDVETQKVILDFEYDFITPFLADILLLENTRIELMRKVKKSIFIV